MLRRGGVTEIAQKKSDRTTSNHHKSGGGHVNIYIYLLYHRALKELSKEPTHIKIECSVGKLCLPQNHNKIDFKIPGDRCLKLGQ